jgi:hypothetical protein
MIDLTKLTPEALAREPYRWAFVNGLFSPADAAALARTFPRDHFKTIGGYDGEKGFQYEARSLVGMGAAGATHAARLSEPWRRFAAELLSAEYRAALSRMTGLDLSALPMEANVSHYGARAWLGPHVDLEDKVVTHVFYFNEEWDEGDGGCLTVLRSGVMSDVVKIVPPVVGNSAVLVRSQNSWHAVSRVRDGCRISRRSLTVTFYRPGSLSTMWPEGDETPLHEYDSKLHKLAEWARAARRRLAR